MQERITLLDKKVEKMKAELQKCFGTPDMQMHAEFFTELLRCVRRSGSMKRLCKVWREECVRAEIEATKDGQYYGMFIA